MIDIINALNNLRPGAAYEGCIEYERPTSPGQFEKLSIIHIRDQYETLKWLDKRPKPTWDEIVTYNEHFPPQRPLLERLTALVSQLSDEEQLGMSGLISLVFVTLSTGNTTRARNLVSKAEIPSDLEPVRSIILEEFDK